MELTVWGARGSVPVSGRDVVLYGGDTTCLELRAASGERIVFDAGTGIRPLGNRILAEGPDREVHLFLTHAHWDHIQGFPFFRPVYRKDFSIRFHGCSTAQDSIRNIFAEAMHPPYFPVKLEDAAAALHFEAACAESFDIGSLRVFSFPLNHPNGGFGFRVEEDGRTLAFFPDYELTFSHPGGRPRAALVEFVRDVDWLLFDAEYTAAEYEAFSRGWGHSVFGDAVLLGRDAGAKGLLLWHLNQDRSDAGVDALVEEARSAAGASGMEVRAAAAGLTLRV